MKRTLAESIHEHLQKLTKLMKFNGAVFVKKEGERALSQGYGKANFEHGIDNTPKTVFRIASLTKPFTSIAILQLYEKGLIELHEPIDRYLPDYPNKHSITVHHLLSQTSGIANYTADPQFARWMAIPSRLDELIERFKDTPLAFEPGQRFQYSNSNYTLLGKIIELVTGETYEDHLRQTLFEPLGMNSTLVDDRQAVIERKAYGYVQDPEGNLTTAPIIDMKNTFAAGSLSSTLEDLDRWDEALSEGTLLRHDTYSMMFEAVQQTYGYGWFLQDTVNGPLATVPGFLPGFHSFLIRYPKTGTTVAVIGNMSADAKSVAMQIHDMLG